MTPEQALIILNEVYKSIHLIDYFFLDFTFSRKPNRCSIFHVCNKFLTDLHHDDGKSIDLRSYSCDCGVKLPEKIIPFIKYARACGYIVH